MVTGRQRWTLILIVVALAGGGMMARPAQDHFRGKRPRFQVFQWGPRVAFASDGKTLACDLVLRDPTDGKEVAKGTLGEEYSGCGRVAYSPDGKRMASVHYDLGLIHARHAICLWDVSVRHEVRKTATLFSAKEQVNPQAESLQYLVFSHDGCLLATRHSDDASIVWHTKTGKERRRLETKGLAVAFTPDGRHLISVTRTGLVQLWDLVTGKCADRVPGPKRDSFVYVSEAIASSDGRTVALTDGRTVVVVDALSGRRLRHFGDLGRFGDLDEVALLALSADGKRLAAACRNEVVLFDTVTGKECGRWRDVAGGRDNRVTALAFSPDGQSLAVGASAFAAVWDLATLAQPDKPRPPPPAPSVEATVVSRNDSHQLDLNGKSVRAYATHFEVGKELPPSPAVDLMFVIRNTSSSPIQLEAKGQFFCYLVGDGAVNHPGLPYQTGFGERPPPPKMISLAPGESHAVPLTHLDHDYHQGSFWLLPGEYTLHVSYLTRVDPAPNGWSVLDDGSGCGFVRAAPLRLKVVE